MFYLSGNKLNNKIGVVDTNDCIEEFYTKEYLATLDIPILGFNVDFKYEDRYKYTIRDKYFTYVLETHSDVYTNEMIGVGWTALSNNSTTNYKCNKSLLGYPVMMVSFEDYDYPTIDISGLDTSNLVSMSRMFFNTKIVNLDLTTFNSLKVRDMSFMFGNSDFLKSIKFSSNFFNGELKILSYMFSNCISLESLDLSGLNHARFVEGMFAYCNSLKSININNFDISNIENFDRMFFNCSSLCFLDLRNFKPNINGSVLNQFMFGGCSNLSVLDITNFRLGRNSSLLWTTLCSNLTLVKCDDISVIDYFFNNRAKWNIILLVSSKVVISGNKVSGKIKIPKDYNLREISAKLRLSTNLGCIIQYEEV